MQNLACMCSPSRCGTGINVCPTSVLPELGLGFQLFPQEITRQLCLLPELGLSRELLKEREMLWHFPCPPSMAAEALLLRKWNMQYMQVLAATSKMGKINSEALLLCQWGQGENCSSLGSPKLSSVSPRLFLWGW